MDNVDTLGIMANVSQSVDIGGKEYKIRALNLLQISKIRQELIDSAKKEWKSDIASMLTLIDIKERSKFLIDAMKAQTIDDAKINEMFASNNGIYKVLSSAMNITEEELVKIYSERNNQDGLLEVYKIAMEIKEEIVETNKTDKTDKTDTNINTEKKV